MRRVFLPFPPAPHATTVRLCGWFLDNLRLGVDAWCAQRDRPVEGCMPVGRFLLQVFMTTFYERYDVFISLVPCET